MIIWLASYPKSGNTLLRAIIASLLYTNNGIFQPNLLERIKKFPTQNNFKNFTNKFYDINETIKYSILSQDSINLNNKINFLKTHHLNCKINNHHFTNSENTLATIYIVRDPRNIVTSISNHYNLSLEDAKIFLFSSKIIGGSKKMGLSINDDIKTLIGTWSEHYKFWKKNKNLLLIKYEDLINNSQHEINKIIIFLRQFLTFEVNELKLINICKSTTFKNLQDIEKKGLFKENAYKNTNTKIKFFFLGPNNKWQNILPKNIRNEIENKFFNEMRELKYL